MNDNEEFQDDNDIIIVISDYEEIHRPQYSVDKPERPRLPIFAKLIALWNLLFELVVGVPFFFLMAWLGDDYGTGAVIVGALLFVCVHTTASVAAFRRYKRKYGVPAWKFVLLNALPLFLISAVIYAAGQSGILVINDFGWAILLFIFCVCFLGYSVVYAALLSAVLGIKFAVSRKKKRP